MVHRFGIFEFDDATRELRRNGRAAALEPQPAKALALLLSRAGDIVTRGNYRKPKPDSASSRTSSASATKRTSRPIV